MGMIKFYLTHPYFMGYVCLSLFSAFMFARFAGMKKGQIIMPVLAMLISIAAWYFRLIRPEIFDSNSAAQEIVIFISYSWLGCMLMASISAVVCFIVFSILKISKTSIIPNAEKYMPFGAFVVLAVYAFYNGMRQPPVVEIEIKSDQVSDELDGYRIVQLSDIHLDSKNKMKRFIKTMERVNSLNADIVLLTGDMIDLGVDESSSADGYFNVLKANDGVYACMGNHEAYFEKNARESRKRTVPLLKRMGLELLYDESKHYKSIELPKFYLTGLADIGSERLKAEKISSKIGNGKKKKPEIVMSHQPMYYKEIAEKHPMLVLSGHTHGGQIFPFSLYWRRRYKYFYGHFVIKDTHFYVSRGAGVYGPIMRFLAPSEVPVLTLRKLETEKHEQK